MRLYYAVIYSEDGVELNRSDEFEDVADAVDFAREECRYTDWHYAIKSTGVGK